HLQVDARLSKASDRGDEANEVRHVVDEHSCVAVSERERERHRQRPHEESEVLEDVAIGRRAPVLQVPAVHAQPGPWAHFVITFSRARQAEQVDGHAFVEQLHHVSPEGGVVRIGVLADDQDATRRRHLGTTSSPMISRSFKTAWSRCILSVAWSATLRAASSLLASIAAATACAIAAGSLAQKSAADPKRALSPARSDSTRGRPSP